MTMNDIFEETELQEQRRLENEARTRLLGTIYHPDCKNDGTDQCAKVEVTYGDRYARHQGDSWGKLLQNAGHFIVHVPTIEPMEDGKFDMEFHPATLAEDLVNAAGVEEDHDYWSIDDISAY